MADTHHTKPTDIGTNRTGVAASPLDARKLVEGAEQASTSEGGPERIAAFRAELSATAPPKGAAKTVAKALQGEQANVLLDKLGERLAFERSGVRLYDAVLAKVPASRTSEGDLDAADLARIRDEEHQHMLLVEDAIRQLGA